MGLSLNSRKSIVKAAAASGKGVSSPEAQELPAAKELPAAQEPPAARELPAAGAATAALEGPGTPETPEAGGISPVAVPPPEARSNTPNGSTPGEGDAAVAAAASAFAAAGAGTASAMAPPADSSGNGTAAWPSMSQLTKSPSKAEDASESTKRFANAVEKVTQAGRIAQALEQAQAEAAARQAILRQSTQFSVAKKLGKPLKRIHMVKILQFAFAGYLAFLAVIVKLFSPSLFWMFFATLGSVPIGIGMSFLFHQNRVNKTETRDKLGVEPGVYGLKQLLHQSPSWLAFQDKEKVEWMNRILKECWPFYDKAICGTIKEMVEPEVDKYKPSFIASIGFKNLTFGESPFRIDTVWTDPEETDRLVMEIVFRWQGDANIGLFIALQGLNQLGGDATKMVVKLTKLQLSGTLRITLSPLVDKIPGFGAITAALTKSPIIKYNLDFGKALGSSFSANLVRNWLDPFIRNTLMELLVWPERIVVPMLPESDTGPLTYLQKRTVGILRVTLKKAWGLRAMDGGITGGASDPFLCIWSNPQRKVETKVVKNTLEPAWEETFYILVQEPTTQMLKLELYDYDTISMKELGGGLNIFKNIRNVYGARELMGRTIVPMKPFCEAPGAVLEQVHDFGLQDWSSIGGPGKGEGKVEVHGMYAPARACRGLGFKTGCLAVKVFSVVGLSGLGLTSDMTVYMRMKLTKQKSKCVSRPVTVKPPSRDPNTHKVEEHAPTWTETFMFYDVRKDDELVVKVVETDSVSDETQGVVYMPLEDHVITQEDSTVNKWYKMEDTSLPTGKIMQMHIKAEWLGFIAEDEGWEDRV